ncbi:hypothetical protein N24_0068 [Corynebacterium suranareeae]|uniref:PIN domain-containing protein n=1 Tax=Corynebacterium suranareeae TaxID=2506452 RepID=A0A160PQ50_9CORY|nr:PIN domain-containing protein [Corynebacterium suranareeae]BAU94330.1 hypothetical protein N24_0068 [Corynebacterium suranareeae]
MASLRQSSVLPDANIWASSTLHSWFALIAVETMGSWSIFWTEDIMAEAVKARRKRFPRSSSTQMESLRDRIVKHFPDNRISNFPHDDTVTYKDEIDSHVHSAAVHANIAIIVTDNIKDFEGIYNDPDDCPYDLLTADEWLMLAAESAPHAIDQVLMQQYSYRLKQQKPFNLVKSLHDAGCFEFAEYIRVRLQEIA